MKEIIKIEEHQGMWGWNLTFFDRSKSDGFYCFAGPHPARNLFEKGRRLSYKGNKYIVEKTVLHNNPDDYIAIYCTEIKEGE